MLLLLQDMDDYQNGGLVVIDQPAVIVVVAGCNVCVYTYLCMCTCVCMCVCLYVCVRVCACILVLLTSTAFIDWVKFWSDNPAPTSGTSGEQNFVPKCTDLHFDINAHVQWITLLKDTIIEKRT